MSSYIDITAAAAEHCESMAALHPDLAEKYNEIATLCSQKLWHQLTLKLMDFLTHPSPNLRTTQEGTSSFLALYDKVILSVDKKLNPLSLAQMASLVSASLETTDGTAAKTVLENLLEKGDSFLGMAATLFLTSRLGLLQLNLLEQGVVGVDATVVLPKIKEQLKKNDTFLEEVSTSKEASIVHSAHYLCGMKYRKAVGPPEAFYKQAIQYLNYTPLEEIANAYELATDVSLAALTGEGVFNLGEVVATTLLTSTLPNTENAYLLELLQAMAAGKVQDFTALSTKYAAQIQSQPALMNRRVAVQEKMMLLALVTMIWEKPASDRTLTFQEIRQRVLVNNHDVDVEMLLMRALSLKLVEGSLDQVDEILQVTWVMPRVLTTEQMTELAARFGEWAVQVSKARDELTEQTPALFA